MKGLIIIFFSPKKKIITEQVHNDDARPNGFIRAGHEKPELVSKKYLTN